MHSYESYHDEIENSKPIIALQVVNPVPIPEIVKETNSESNPDVIKKSVVVKRRRSRILTDQEKNYALYNKCRSFEAAVFRKHINLSLIQKRSTSGIIVLRPHQCKKRITTNNLTFISQVFSNLKRNGNNGHIYSLPTTSQPYLFRNLPSDTELDSNVILTPTIQVLRGPGRPYGSFTTKKSSKRQSGTKKSETKRRCKTKVAKDDCINLPEVPPLPTHDIDVNSDTDEEDEFEKEQPTMVLKDKGVTDIFSCFDYQNLVKTK